jgi:cyclophilin family peptidyl-prolyl cis-trans isomerase
VARRRRLSLIAALALAAAAAGCGGGSSHSAAPPSTTAPTTTGVPGVCATPSAPPKIGPRRAPRPRATLNPAAHFDVTFVTNCGSFTVAIDQRTSPHLAASFVSLVRRHYFDRTVFHRIIPGFVVQGGDPTATGTGGPGYTTVDRVPKSTAYTDGVVAMAKTAAQKAGTAGSQFFVVIGSAAAQLPPEYAVLGKVVRGMDTVNGIGLLGNRANGAPTETVEIERATVSAR